MSCQHCIILDENIRVREEVVVLKMQKLMKAQLIASLSIGDLDGPREIGLILGFGVQRGRGVECIHTALLALYVADHFTHFTKQTS